MFRTASLRSSEVRAPLTVASGARRNLQPCFMLMVSDKMVSKVVTVLAFASKAR